NIEIAVNIANPPVGRAVDLTPRDTLPVCADIALVVAPDGLHETGWCGADDYDDAFLTWLCQFFAGGLMYQADVVPVHWHAGATHLAALWLHAISHCKNGPSAFCLPVVIDDWYRELFTDP